MINGCARSSCPRRARLGKKLCAKCAWNAKQRKRRSRLIRKRLPLYLVPRGRRSQGHRLCAWTESPCRAVVRNGATYCAAHRAIVRKRESYAREKQQLAARRRCVCGKPVKQGALCRGCAARASLAATAAQKHAAPCSACNGVGHRQAADVPLAEIEKHGLWCRQCGGRRTTAVVQPSHRERVPWREDELVA